MSRFATSRQSILLVSVVATFLPGVHPRSALAQHKVVLQRRGETVFASLPFDPAQAKTLSLSPGATRSAYVRQKEGRFCAVIDGAEGALYDRIGRAGVVFSPDGHHTAYAAEKDQRWRVIYDGNVGEPFDSVRDESITFGPLGDRIAFVAGRDGKMTVVIDGNPGHAHARVTDGSITFSPDGLHAAYVAADDGAEFVVYDGVQGPAYASVGPPRFSADSAHFAYAASDAERSHVVLDEKVEATRDGPGSIRSASLTFSPDGRIAYVVAADGGKERVVFDGQDGKVYDRIFDNSITFNRGRSPVYVANASGRARVVVDGTEIGVHAGVVPGSIRFSPDGRRVAYLVERADGGAAGLRRCAAVDGVEGKPYDWIGEPPVFSVDGLHVAYVAERRKPDDSGFQSLLVVDGTESASPYPWIRGDPVFRVDGRRIAYLAAATDARFADVGLVPRHSSDAAAGARMVFHRSPGVERPRPPAERPLPIKLLIVEEDVVVD